MKLNIDFVQLDTSRAPQWSEAGELTFEDHTLYGAGLIVIRFNEDVEEGENLIIKISDLKRVVKTL